MLATLVASATKRVFLPHIKSFVFLLFPNSYDHNRLSRVRNATYRTENEEERKRTPKKLQKSKSRNNSLPLFKFQLTSFSGGVVVQTQLNNSVAVHHCLLLLSERKNKNTIGS